MEEQRENRDLMDNARQDGYDVVTIPENVKTEIEGSTDVEGNEMRDVGAYSVEYEESFEYDWVSESELTSGEQEVWELRHDILSLIDDLPEIEEIRISSRMRVTGGSDWKTEGTWEPLERRIVIHRPILNDPVDFAATLLHEIAHPKSGDAPDQTREFEKALTDLLGEIAISGLGEGASRSTEEADDEGGWSFFSG
jgi:hypothetical protein